MGGKPVKIASARVSWKLYICMCCDVVDLIGWGQCVVFSQEVVLVHTKMLDAWELHVYV